MKNWRSKRAVAVFSPLIFKYKEVLSENQKQVLTSPFQSYVVGMLVHAAVGEMITLEHAQY